jgi:hypothetical protein
MAVAKVYKPAHWHAEHYSSQVRSLPEMFIGSPGFVHRSPLIAPTFACLSDF